ncbi:S10 family peptidase, partial [Arachidicoccus sp.]|uniref:S10 family peptidase n=1 Tax=Arachidicoccus sp. TaxID=1872624 RepID=UPI003D195B7B
VLSACLFGLSFSSYGQPSKEKDHAVLERHDSGTIDYKAPQKSVTEGSVTVEGKKIDYQAVAGTLILKNSDDKPTISIFYTAYFKAGEKDPSQRPITFIYNGGPGSATFWLHMGAWGPQRVLLNDTSRTKAPYKTVNNDYSLLDASDLVFIDAPGTGFGKIITKDMGGAGDPKDFYGIDQDGSAFANFIQQFISQYNRWNSPKYLFGESYGTFRSAVVSNILETRDKINLNGIILLSQLLNYGFMTETAGRNPGDGLPYELVLPSFAATAWYHHKLPNQPEQLEPFLKEVEHFAMSDYALALNQGAALDKNTFNQIAEKLHQYTGLPVAYLKKANLRVNGPQFEQTLLADSSEITGRLDSRFSGKAIDPLSEDADYDPMDSYIDAAFTATFNNYVRTELKFGKGMQYHTSGGGQWDFKRKGFIGFPNVMNDLADAMVYNPNLKIMLNSGYFDLGTPFYEGEYEMQHLPMPVELQKNIEYARYYSGHMVYLHPQSLKKLHDNVAMFIRSTY